MLENKETGEVNVTEEHPLKALIPSYNNLADLDDHVLFDLPSPQITPNHMMQIAGEIKEKEMAYDGFVITHGTDTLEETAFFLDLVTNVEKPIVVTGAMRSSNEIGSDALYNLISSIRVAADDSSNDKGVVVVMNDEIHAAENVTKTSTSNIATFQSPQYGPIGMVTKDSIIYKRTVLGREQHHVREITKKVILLKAYAGMERELFEAILEKNPDGLVIEAFGQGNLPGDIVPVLNKFIERDIPVVCVSRSFQGVVQPTYAYDGGGKQLERLGVIYAGGLTGPKARLKLMIALETTTNMEEVRALFHD